MSFATAVIPWLVHRDCCDHIRGVDIVGVGVVGVNGNALAVMLDMIGTQIYGYFKSSPRRCGFSSGAGKRVKRFDRIDPMPFVDIPPHQPAIKLVKY